MHSCHINVTVSADVLHNVAAKLVHLIISCSLATFEFSPSNYAPQWGQYVGVLKLRRKTLHSDVIAEECAEKQDYA